MKILGIETSCDETSTSIVENGRSVLSNCISSSQELFESLGGVIPEQAARMQVECITALVQKSIQDANLDTKDIDAIAVTKGPGLVSSLYVGTMCARTLHSLWHTPCIGVHHTLGHLSSIWLDTKDRIEFPILTLSASGGHTDLWLRVSHTKGVLIGRTLDDAAGEAFDKGAALLHLGYPGGPKIAQEALHGNKDYTHYPLPLKGKPGCNFSFSGLKTHLKNSLPKNEQELKERTPDIAASFQHGICLHLLDRIKDSLQKYPDCKEIHIVGGCSANIHLRTLLEHTISLKVRWPQQLSYCTDNAAMVASAGYFLYTEKPDAYDAPFETDSSIELEKVLTI